MNNSGALYVEHSDHHAVAAALTRLMGQRGYRPSQRPAAELCGRIMLPDKPWRHFLIAPAKDGWIAIWEDPRYFADRTLAKELAAQLVCRSLWIEVGGNGVSWARGLYHGTTTLNEHYEPVTTTFYGEYGVINLAFDLDSTPEELIAELALPYSDWHYEAALAHEWPELIHCCVER